MLRETRNRSLPGSFKDLLGDLYGAIQLEFRRISRRLISDFPRPRHRKYFQKFSFRIPAGFPRIFFVLVLFKIRISDAFPGFFFSAFHGRILDMFTPRYGTVKSGLKTFKGILQDFFFGFQPLAVGLGSLGLFLIRKILWDFSGSSSWHLLGIFFLLRIFQDLSVVFQDSGGKISGYPSLFSGSFFIWIFYGFSGFDSEFLLRILRGFSRIFCGIL